MNMVDARGLSCPEPVMVAKRELERHPEGIEIILDTHVSVENVNRLVHNMGYCVSINQEDENYHLIIKKQDK